jgi:hypothetical protein
MKVNVDYERISYFEGGDDGDDGDGTSSTWSRESEYEVKGISRHEEGEYELPDGTTEAYVVYAFYGDGDTFGHSSGDLLILGVYADLWKAKYLEDEVRTIVNGGSYCSEVLDHDGNSIWISDLTGYFNQCEKITTERFDIK